MKESMFDVLMYLFENYYMDDDPEWHPDRESLHVELSEAGFTPGEIHKAFEWLDGLAQYRDASLPNPQPRRALRVYTDAECQRLDLECRGFILFLEQMDILTPASRELIIDRVMALDAEEVDIDQLKWIILMVLFNQPGEEAAYAWMEDLVFDEYAGKLH